MIDILRTVREKLKYLPARLFNFHNDGDNKDIFIFTSPRSGSTWLMELIASQDNIKYVNEPLHINRHKGLLTDINPNWVEIYSGQDRKRKFCNFFNRIISEELFVGQQKFKEIHKGQFDYFTNRRVFKILRGKDLINVFEEKFEIQVVYLLRHPIAVALSLMKEDLEDRVNHFLANKDYKEQFLHDDLIEFSRSILKNGSRFEIKILQWCLENLPSLKFLNNKNWIVISYEEMVVEEEKILRELYKELELENLDKLYSQVKIPSRTTDEKNQKFINDSTNEIINKEFLIKKWDNVVSQIQKEKAFAILDEFGIDIYQLGQFTINKKSEFFIN
ncbi:sulfotransferase [Selenihalanaerobacter shriftii]|uniref:Sulfotransferase family protein n=1 Tax=Selenihalanaerobacter shriftii TaxID=142842 RepID=A0A1T4KWI9_9FIRM|nr:sulfotransferase [Selenihalanaerobacter shriftii]SJZ46794.1 Sulfotransferase family protein [Selenihalanaerobacter shriftii]